MPPADRKHLGRGLRGLQKKEEGTGRKRKENKGRIILTTCEVQNVSSCPALKGGAIEAALLHGTSAANADIIAKQGFNERFTKRALYGKCVYLTIDTYRPADSRAYGVPAQSNDLGG